MMLNQIKVQINGMEKYYPYGTTYGEIAKEYVADYPYDIVLAQNQCAVRELHRIIPEGENNIISFLTTADSEGFRAYQRSMTLLLLKAFHDLTKSHMEKLVVDFSVSKGVYCKVSGNIEINESLLKKVSERMKELVAQDITIYKRTVNIDEALKLFRECKMYDKEKLFKYRRVSKINLYKIEDFEDYYYGYMVPSTGCLKYFELYPYEEGFVLQLPERKNPIVVPPFKPAHKVFSLMQDAANWQNKLGVDTVGALNDKIVKGEMNELILVQEAIMEKRIAEIAEQILEEKGKKIVLIAGPSSSGKTTFSHRLSIQLIAHGMRPHPIAIDNYFVNRVDSPKDEFGNYNFEAIECVDMKTLNSNLNDLLAGKEVLMPTYNFLTGMREYKGNTLQIGKEDILVLEGIHCLNDRLTAQIPAENKFKIYISALNQLNIDEHNRIPTTDGRLLRRMVRDNRTRGTSAKKTIATWYSVRKGEESNIFPYQEEADTMFNSSLIYELGVLKQYAEPLLFGIQKGEPEYEEARRLLKFLDYFLGVNSEDIPKNSILREFIGGSCFHV